MQPGFIANKRIAMAAVAVAGLLMMGAMYLNTAHSPAPKILTPAEMAAAKGGQPAEPPYMARISPNFWKLIAVASTGAFVSYEALIAIKQVAANIPGAGGYFLPHVKAVICQTTGAAVGYIAANSQLAAARNVQDLRNIDYAIAFNRGLWPTLWIGGCPVLVDYLHHRTFLAKATEVAKDQLEIVGHRKMLAIQNPTTPVLLDIQEITLGVELVDAEQLLNQALTHQRHVNLAVQSLRDCGLPGVAIDCESVNINRIVLNAKSRDEALAKAKISFESIRDIIHNYEELLGLPRTNAFQGHIVAVD